MIALYGQFKHDKLVFSNVLMLKFATQKSWYCPVGNFFLQIMQFHNSKTNILYQYILFEHLGKDLII